MPHLRHGHVDRRGIGHIQLSDVPFLSLQDEVVISKRKESDKKKDKKAEKKRRDSSDSEDSSDEEDVKVSKKKDAKADKKDSKKKISSKKSKDSDDSDNSDEERSSKSDKKSKSKDSKDSGSKRKNKDDGSSDEQDQPKKKQKGSDGAAVTEKPLSPAEYRQKFEITVTGGPAPNPVQSFDAAGLNSELVSAVKAAGFSSPSPIQGQCWPLLMEGKDVIAIAKTGSGKTCGFLFPAFMLIRNSVNMRPKRGDGPVAVALAP